MSQLWLPAVSRRWRLRWSFGGVREIQERGEPHPDLIARKGVAVVIVTAADDHQARCLQLSERVGRLQGWQLESLRDLRS
jgi:hypothetical protein